MPKTKFQQTSIINTHVCTQEFHDLYLAQGICKQTITAFQDIILTYFNQCGRQFRWRQYISPYNVVISEVMLQQTQTDRVAQKFDLFIARFPDFATLATAPFDEVLKTWKGLGYNRRAINLQKIAQAVVSNFNGQLPSSPETLITLPSIGKATASSICAFAFNAPTVFIETNIRTVFIYFFFPNRTNVHDNELMPLIEKALDTASPRLWYYALMDYGVMLKKTVWNVSQLSKHYTKQSKFEGSDRQIRGRILQVLIDTPDITEFELCQKIGKDHERILGILGQLIDEKFIQKKDDRLFLKS